MWYRSLLDGPNRLTGHTVEDIKETSLARLHHRLDGFAIDHDLPQCRRADSVILPKIVMDHLKVPYPLAGAGIQTDERLGVDVVAEALSAVLVSRGVAEVRAQMLARACGAALTVAMRRARAAGLIAS